ncbi:MAG TPA: hypothetical protein VIG33_00505 [Pseudobdellovibrionaceae bacterium]
MNWVLNAFFILSAMAADLHKELRIDAYNLHQALNYMNVYTSGKCEAALDLAKKHLSQIKEKSNKAVW